MEKWGDITGQESRYMKWAEHLDIVFLLTFNTCLQKCFPIDVLIYHEQYIRDYKKTISI